MSTKEAPGLLTLLNSRWDAFIKQLPDAYTVPPQGTRDNIEDAARLHARANHTDPFAYGRIKMEIKRGLADWRSVRTEALSRMASLSDGHVGIVFPAAEG